MILVYKPGTLRASWTTALEERSGIPIATVFNSEPYAERVEFGWSSQAPQGMLRITIKEWQSIVAKSARKNKI